MVRRTVILFAALMVCLLVPGCKGNDRNVVSSNETKSQSAPANENSAPAVLKDNSSYAAASQTESAVSQKNNSFNGNEKTASKGVNSCVSSKAVVSSTVSNSSHGIDLPDDMW